MKTTKKQSKAILPGGVDAYIAACPKEIRANLQEMRAAIRNVAPDAVETVSYFDMPGYSYQGYAYNGMFAWFSYKKPFVRLHVRPEAIAMHQQALEKYGKTKAIISFPSQGSIPKSLVQKLVQSSINAMTKSRSISIDKYINKLPEPQRSALGHVRELLHEIVPECSECISYGIPAFKLGNKVIAGFAAGKKYCSYYPFSGRTLKTIETKLLRYDRTMSALHFPHNKPLSKAIIQLLVKTRLNELKKGPNEKQSE